MPASAVTNLSEQSSPAARGAAPAAERSPGELYGRTEGRQVNQRAVVGVVTEDHYVRTPEGVFVRLTLDYDYWRQYLSVFDEVRPIARVERAEKAEAGWRRADGPGVVFADIPFYQGLRGMLRAAPRTLAALRRHLRETPYLCMRGSGGLCLAAWLLLRASGRPYARQIVGHDQQGLELSARMRPVWLRRLLGRAALRASRAAVRRACCAAYVTRALHSEYPNERPFFFSDVNLDERVVTAPRAADQFAADRLRLVSVGRMNPEKGYDVLLEALHRLAARGEERVTLEVIGDGVDLEALRRRTMELGLAERCRFAGWVQQGAALNRRLDEADVYVLPSLTEGTPRALLEAMARGLPVLASEVGGVPALVREDALVPPGNAAALSEAIARLIGAREELAQRSQDCFERAMLFRKDVMLQRKREYWTCLRECTDAWRRRRGRG